MTGHELRDLRAALSERDARIAELQDRLQRQGMYDPLTGLPNRALLLDRVERALALARRSPCVTALIVLDIDRFARLNDWLGREGGDAALIELARRLSGLLRSGDTVARVGADEFVVLCVQLEGEDAAHAAVGRVLSALEQPIGTGDGEFAVTVSAGVALAYDGRRSPAELLADATSALDGAKRRGGRHHELFDVQLRARAVDRVRLENDLRHAVERDELRLEYQPIIGLREGRIAAVEALVRWRHPRLGLLGPDRFVGIAEESGLIGDIGAWVLRAATAQAAHWARVSQRAAAPSLELAVNLSTWQLRHPEALVRTVEDALQASGLPPELLALEITESALLDDTEGEAATAALQRLRTLGVRIVLDDFGTGYASLAQLKRLRFDAIKLDRSFVASLGGVDEDEDALLVSAIIRMATALGLTVVAEGVESPRQLRRLSTLRCTQGQGFHFARPLEAARLQELLAHEPPTAWTAS